MAGKYKGPRRSLVIRDNDLIWIARMVVGEGGYQVEEDAASALMWAMAHRYLLHPKQSNWPNFTALLKAFAQPINPIWDGNPNNQSGTDKCEPGGQYYGTDHCSPSRLARRKKMANMAWEDIPLRVRNWVVEFQNGVLFPPDKLARLRKPRISNWGAKSMKKNLNGKKVPLSEWAPHGINLGNNWFFEDKSLIDGFVDVESDPNAPRRRQKTNPLGIIASVLLMGAAVLGTKLFMDYVATRG